MKIINHRLSPAILYFFSLIFCIILGFLIGRTSKIINSVPEMQIIEKADFTSQNDVKSDKSLIFGSRQGKYFYYKGCGGDSISPKNLVYYKTESEAIAKGKSLYSKCQ